MPRNINDGVSNRSVGGFVTSEWDDVTVSPRRRRGSDDDEERNFIRKNDIDPVHGDVLPLDKLFL
jgi:hypothetical protein